ncbi:PRC and DUF2382 domain-containing protein [Polymorphospora sp. NPDC051019]|uniref:PRC and DUF2382 domain-containing protein n=1 Tax=Polymorphospora sp. NPDC051019 TaxID=3155725 RepID=UPI00344A209B
MRMTQDQLSMLQGQPVQDRSGKKLGRVGQIWMDRAGEPNWVSVKTGFFGNRESMVPLEPARMEQDHLVVPYEKDMIKKAPHVEAAANEPLSDPEVDDLYAYYNLQQAPPAKGASAAGPERGRQEQLTRSEERLRVGKSREPAGAARLRKYVVTENVHTTVPVSHDEVRLAHEPFADNSGGERPDIGDATREIDLYAEKPVIGKETVPVERVRMTEEDVTEDRSIDEPVRREKIEADFPDRSGRSG